MSNNRAVRIAEAALPALTVVGFIALWEAYVRLRGIATTLGDFLKAEVVRDLVMANVPPAWVHHVRPEQSPSEVRS